MFPPLAPRHITKDARLMFGGISSESFRRDLIVECFNDLGYRDDKESLSQGAISTG